MTDTPETPTAPDRLVEIKAVLAEDDACGWYRYSSHDVGRWLHYLVAEVEALQQDLACLRVSAKVAEITLMDEKNQAEAERARLRGLIHDVRQSGVEHTAPGYEVVQIDKALWAALEKGGGDE